MEFIHTAVLIACNESLMATQKVSIKMREKQQQLAVEFRVSINCNFAISDN